MKRGERKQAFFQLVKGTEVQPEEPFWHIEMAKMLITEGDIIEGCKEFSVALKLSKVEVKDFENKLRKITEVCKK